MSQKLFPVTYLQPEIELVHLLCMRRYYRHKSPENGVARKLKLQRIYRKWMRLMQIEVKF